jgi:CTP:molybdopterin cytidylyltransferase MocA
MMLGDLPYINAADLRQLIEQFKVRTKGEAVMPMVGEHAVIPLLFPKKF